MSPRPYHPPSAELLSEISGRLADLDTHGALIYSSKGQTIHRFQASGLDLIAKSYPLNSLSRKIAALFKSSRAQRSHRAGIRFWSAGIETPKPIGLIEEGALLPTRATLISEYCPHPVLIESLSNDLPVDPQVPKRILTLLHQLEAASCSHGDFHARNILVDEAGLPHLIDLDGVRVHSRKSRLRHYLLKDRDRFLRSIKPMPHHYEHYIESLGEPGSPLPDQ